MLLIRNGYVKTMAGPDLPSGCVLIGDDGKILSSNAESGQNNCGSGRA